MHGDLTAFMTKYSRSSKRLAMLSQKGGKVFSKMECSVDVSNNSLESQLIARKLMIKRKKTPKNNMTNRMSCVIFFSSLLLYNASNSKYKVSLSYVTVQSSLISFFPRR